jgi:hypothetical protein
MTKVRRGKGKVRDHEGDIRYLISFLGSDLLKHIKRLSLVTGQRETLQVAGEILGGGFKLSVTFNGEEKH